MDFSFYHWGPWLQKPDKTWPHGYITGSGLPMKFVRTDGTLTSVYQQLTEMADDQLFSALGGYEGLSGSQVVALSQSLIDASLAGNYSALTDIHHVKMAPGQDRWIGRPLATAGTFWYATGRDRSLQSRGRRSYVGYSYFPRDPGSGRGCEARCLVRRPSPWRRDLPVNPTGRT